MKANNNRKKANKKKSKANIIAVTCLAAAVLILGIVLASTLGAKPVNKAAKTAKPSASVIEITSGEDIVIDKSKITEQAAFFPYKAGNIEMEVLAVKAPDGTIRTAMNTCQVCYDSGAGYYEQEGDELICQNCGNRFKISKVEKQKNGCNPVPITGEDKIEDDNTILYRQPFWTQTKNCLSIGNINERSRKVWIGS